jgi:hypothetical protein
MERIGLVLGKQAFSSGNQSCSFGHHCLIASLCRTACSNTVLCLPHRDVNFVVVSCWKRRTIPLGFSVWWRRWPNYRSTLRLLRFAFLPFVTDFRISWAGTVFIGLFIIWRQISWRGHVASNKKRECRWIWRHETVLGTILAFPRGKEKLRSNFSHYNQCLAKIWFWYQQKEDMLQLGPTYCYFVKFVFWTLSIVCMSLKSQRFGSWIFFRLQVKNGRTETHLDLVRVWS